MPIITCSGVIVSRSDFYKKTHKNKCKKSSNRQLKPESRMPSKRPISESQAQIILDTQIARRLRRIF